MSQADSKNGIIDTGAPHHLSEAQKKSLMGLATGLLVVGLGATAAALAVGGHRAGFSYLVGYMWATTIALGALGFSLIWRLTKAGWPVATRRHAEWLASFLPVAIVLFIPIILNGHDIYHHWMGPEAASDEILKKKAAWLNPTGFYVRAFIYLGIWSALVLIFRRFSYRQDQDGDKQHTIKAQFFSAPAILLYALSVSFAAFDWEMSTDPHWFSTIYGLYVFSGGAVAGFAALSLMTVAIRSRGMGGKILTIEHQHDVGKMLFGFTVFWAYIAFSQYILIWYANIPEETIWYRHRWEHGWKPFSLGILFLHFIVPFLLNLSRHAKRKNAVLVTTAIIMLVAHFMDHFFLVMPTFTASDAGGGHFSFSWVDIAAFLGPASALFFVVAWNMAKGPLYPIRDPRIPESMRVENIV
jgi:hypothetical protein